jgi:hypothetical protein
MAEIIDLMADQSPPVGGVWVLLEQGQDGLFNTRSQHMQGSVLRHDHPGGRWPLEQAIERAQQDAAVFDIPTIYVKRV